MPLMISGFVHPDFGGVTEPLRPVASHWPESAASRDIIPNGFRHFGFGGSGAWTDPDNDLAVAFVCNRVAGTPCGDLRFLRIGARARADAMPRVAPLLGAEVHGT